MNQRVVRELQFGLGRAVSFRSSHEKFVFHGGIVMTGLDKDCPTSTVSNQAGGSRAGNSVISFQPARLLNALPDPQRGDFSDIAVVGVELDVVVAPRFPFHRSGFGVECAGGRSDGGGEVDATAVGADNDAGRGEKSEIFSHVGEAGRTGSGTEFSAELLENAAFFGEGIGVYGNASGEQFAAELDVVLHWPETKGAFGGTQLKHGEGLSFIEAPGTQQFFDPFAGGRWNFKADVIRAPWE